MGDEKRGALSRFALFGILHDGSERNLSQRGDEIWEAIEAERAAARERIAALEGEVRSRDAALADVCAAKDLLRYCCDGLLRILADKTELTAQLAAVQAELEQERVRLAGCGVAALGYGTPMKPGEYGHSASYDDVMRLRAEVAALRAALEAAADALRVTGEWLRDHSGLDTIRGIKGTVDGILRDAEVARAALSTGGGPGAPGLDPLIRLADSETLLAGAVKLLRLHVKDAGSFDPKCAHDNGEPCYCCRTFAFLRDNFTTPSPGDAPASSSTIAEAPTDTNEGSADK